MAGDTVAIKFVGHGVIGEWTIGEHTWNAETKFTQNVSVELAAQLITYPKPGRWAVAPDQKVSETTIKKLVELTGGNETEIKALFAAATSVAPADKGK